MLEPSEGLQHGNQKPVETSGVYFGSHKTFILSVKLENICIDTSLNMPMSRIVEKPCYVFKVKWSTKLKTGQQIFV